MQTLIAVLAAALMLAVMQLGVGAPTALADPVPGVCVHRYNACLDHCQMPDRQCYRGCQQQLQKCANRSR